MKMPVATVYYSPQCPSCVRFMKTVQRLEVDVAAVDVSQTPVRGLTAVPTVVTTHNQTLVGTKAFEWLQTFEANRPLTAYATVLGEGCGSGLSYTDLDSDETVATTPFSAF